MQLFRKLRNARQQRGLSFLEFVGCLISMVGGVILGSMYLGIDVQRMAVGVLEQAQVVAPGYFNQATRPVKNQSLDAAVADGEDAKELTEGLEGSALKDAEETVAEDSASTEAGTQLLPEATDEERRLATRAYWDKLTACMLAEAQGRVQEVGNPEEWQLYDYLTKRKQGHELALAELKDLETFGVDERLVSHGEQVVTWHKSGIKLFSHALSLLTDGPGAKLTGPFAQSWQSAATQLRMEENLVVDRHKGVANYLDRQYAEEAPFVPAF